MHFISDVRTDDEIRTQSFEVRLPRWYKDSEYGLSLVISQKNTHVPMGVTGWIERSEDIAEVVFILASEFQGQGVGSESLKDIVRFAFAEYGYRKLTATVTAGNHALCRILHEAGFQHEGTLRKNYFIPGDWAFCLLREAVRD